MVVEVPEHAGPSPPTKWIASWIGWTALTRKFSPCPTSRPSGSVAMSVTALELDWMKLAVSVARRTPAWNRSYSAASCSNSPGMRPPLRFVVHPS
ncbi:hypothetical protein AB0L41_10375 [Amycolatopsis mediterranei]|uniref:hypothetical protein n=1 Tax=Amycolatopsis mediterranei TaxID=33910 RepID=UPI003441B811